MRGVVLAFVVSVSAAALGLGSVAATAETRELTSEQQYLKNARALHQRLFTFDAHADIEIPGKPSMYVGADGLSCVAVEKMQAGICTAVSGNVDDSFECLLGISFGEL